MTRAKLIAYRAIGLPLAYAVLTAVLPLIGNYDDPERFLKLWAESAFSLMLVVFFVVYAMALLTAFAGDPSRDAFVTGNGVFDSDSHRVGVNGLPLNNGLDPYGSPMGISTSSPEIKISDD